MDQQNNAQREPSPADRMKKLPLITLMVANAISLIGNMTAMIAIPWFVLQTTQSPAQTGLSAFFNTLATVIAALIGGTIVDRLGFKKTSILADLASGVTVLLIPLLYATLGLQYWQLLILVFAGAFLDAPGDTARAALMPDLAKMAGWNLEQAGAAIQAVERGARMLGAPLGGLLIALIGTHNVLWVDAATFGVSALLVWLVIPAISAARPAEEKRPGFTADLQTGVRFIFSDRLMTLLVTLIIITNFLDAPAFGVLYPVYVRQFFGSALDLGLLISASGGGALLGAVAFGFAGHRLPRRVLFFSGFFLFALKCVFMAFVPPYWAILVASFVAGVGSGPINPIFSAMEYERIPIHLRGRVLGAITAMAWAAIPLGMLVGGVAAEWVDVRVVLAVIGLLYFGATLGFALHPAARDMNTRRVPEAS